MLAAGCQVEVMAALSYSLGGISISPQTPIDQDELPSWTSQKVLSVGNAMFKLVSPDGIGTLSLGNGATELYQFYELQLHIQVGFLPEGDASANDSAQPTFLKRRHKEDL